MNKGRFITFEGGEGCGKSTQARLLAEWLSDKGEPVLLTREPGGTIGAEAIRDLLLHPPAELGWKMPAEALLFAAARADHVHRTIAPALAKGQWVICDRFVDSSCAYQGIAGGMGIDAVHSLHAIGSSGLLPNRTVLLELSPAEAAVRLRERDLGKTDVIGGRSDAYHRKVADAFSALAEAEPERFATVDGIGSVAEVQKRVRAAVKPLLVELA